LQSLICILKSIWKLVLAKFNFVYVSNENTKIVL
jgi:hypothetical protein